MIDLSYLTFRDDSKEPPQDVIEILMVDERAYEYQKQAERIQQSGATNVDLLVHSNVYYEDDDHAETVLLSNDALQRSVVSVEDVQWEN